jgi:metal-dependent amidase/aminoacylase/carboxypeptidase family protein
MTLWSKRNAAIAVVLISAIPVAGQNSVDQSIDKNIGAWLETYQHLHQNPELSTQEKETSAFVAAGLKTLDYEVTDHFGEYLNPGDVSYGVVGVLKNGAGRVVYVRTELDGLPVSENTGVPYASKVKVKRANGEVGVMHACGHDLHMTVFLGTAKILAENKSQWSGTVVMIGQPSEEVVSGAAAMLRAGLFTKFPKPDYVIALHDSACPRERLRGMWDRCWRARIPWTSRFVDTEGTAQCRRSPKIPSLSVRNW